MIRSLAVVPILVALAGCGDQPGEAPADDGRGAEGEVLGGTINDAMLPLPTVRSQSPPLEGATGSPDSPAGEAGGQTTPAPEASPGTGPTVQAAPEETGEAEAASEEAEE